MAEFAYGATAEELKHTFALLHPVVCYQEPVSQGKKPPSMKAKWIDGQLLCHAGDC